MIKIIVSSCTNPLSFRIYSINAVSHALSLGLQLATLTVDFHRPARTFCANQSWLYISEDKSKTAGMHSLSRFIGVSQPMNKAFVRCWHFSRLCILIFDILPLLLFQYLDIVSDSMPLNLALISSYFLRLQFHISHFYCHSLA